MKYIIYCRKSTDTEDKQLLSLDAQERELLEIANKNNLVVVKILRESMSAKNVGRPVFAEMIKMILTGKADAILCWKIDRLARNMIDGGNIIDLLGKGIIKEIRTYESVHLPTENAILLAVNFGSANQYSRDLSVNVKRGNREKLNRGEWPNFAPMGYLNDKINKTIVIDKTRAKYIVKAFELYSTGGYGMNDLVSILYNEGFRSRSGKKVYKNQMERIIKNPFYAGLMPREDKLYKGNHQPLISVSMLEKIKRVANDRSRTRPKNHFFPLRGFLKCENCGCLITASKKKGHDYYYCTNGKKICEESKKGYIRENSLYEEIANVFKNLYFSEDKIELMYQAAKEKTDSNSEYLKAALNSLQNDLESLRAKESKLLDVFLAEQITKEIYDNKISDIQIQKTIIEKQIDQLQKKQPSFTLEPIKNIFLQGNISSKEFLEGDEHKKREIIKNLLWNLTIKDKKILKIQYKSPFDIIAKAPKNGPILNLLRG